MKNKIVLVGGGARSGKSRFALEYAMTMGEKRHFVATAQAFDSEMHDRIRRHREERGPAFTTIEEPLRLGQVLRETVSTDVVVVDCLTLWLSNLLIQGCSEKDIQIAVEEVIAVCAARPFNIVLVSNEVGLGIVPESALGRTFRDIAGRAHQRLVSVSDEIFFAAMGLMVRLLPAPVLALRPGETWMEAMTSEAPQLEGEWFGK